MRTRPELAPHGIEGRILTVRGMKVLLDEDLAALYGVPTKVLLQAVRRNRKRFPTDFMFQIDRQDLANLRSQFVTSSYGGRRYLPCVFTQEGVAMLSSVLRSARAVAMNIEVMRAFVRLRQMALSVEELAKRVQAMEQNYDERFRIIFAAIKELMTPSEPGRRIGFVRTD